MKTECSKCINQNSTVCSSIPDISNCAVFTLKKEYIKERTIQLINETTKEELYRYLFNTLKMYLDMNSPYNQYDDMILYYSIDQGKFLKRHSRNNKDRGNWIELEYNVHHFYNLKQTLGLTDPKQTIKENGRLIHNKLIKDDTWLSFVNFVKVTFKKFYDSNRVINTNSVDISTNLEAKPIKLF